MKTTFSGLWNSLKSRAAHGETPSRLWAPYARTLISALLIQLALIAALVLAANPYGNLPSLPGRGHTIMDSNQRYQYPAIARSGRFDSAVVGTSTSRLLRPEALNREFGGRFANLAMDSATAWEQYRMAKLFAASVPQPRTLLVGLDTVWCRPDAAEIRVTKRGFPEWMFDSDPWNDALYMLNSKTLVISIRHFGLALGLTPPRIAADGYHVFVPPEAAYDLARAKANIYANMETASSADSAEEPSAETRAAWQFPALVWLEELLGAGWQRVILIMTPVHVAARPGGLGSFMEEECKARIATLAQGHNVPLIDFRIASDITTRDENYWDALHFRVPIAEKVVTELARALESARDDAAGNWRILSGAQ